MSERSAGSEPAPEEFDVAVGGGFFSRGPEGIGESFFLDAPAEDALELPGGPDADPAIELRRTMARAAAVRLFHFSLLYLALLFVAMAIDTVVI